MGMFGAKRQARNNVQGTPAMRGAQRADKILLFPLNISFYPIFALVAYLKHDLLMIGTVLRLLSC